MAVSGYPDGRSKRTLETLAGRGDVIPEFELRDSDNEYLIEWFFILRELCPDTGFGESAIQPATISDWADMSGNFISAPESAIILKMDVAYRKGLSSIRAYFEARKPKE